MFLCTCFFSHSFGTTPENHSGKYATLPEVVFGSGFPPREPRRSLRGANSGKNWNKTKIGYDSDICSYCTYSNPVEFWVWCKNTGNFHFDVSSDFSVSFIRKTGNRKEILLYQNNKCKSMLFHPRVLTTQCQKKILTEQRYQGHSSCTLKHLSASIFP